ncbi:MAG TPA: helix-turn-helix domain-containing protein [Defluviitaleaceae bacterium]|nr:helix-turn-helix domain-containing protein [Defluviitaleaceae bacterium]
MKLKQNLTQYEVAQKVGISTTTYTNIDLGKKNPSLKIALRIKKVLNYKDDNIFLPTK